MLHRGTTSLSGELRQASLVNVMSASGLDTNRPHMLQAFDQTEHGGRLGSLWHLPQPGEPGLAGFLAVVLAALRQRIETPALLGGQAKGQPVMHVPPGLMTHFSAK